MASPVTTLQGRLLPAFEAVEAGADPVIRRSKIPGVDFQANGALPLAKKSGERAASIAERVVTSADLGDIADVSAHASGFINLTLHDSAVSRMLAELAQDPALGIVPSQAPRRIVVDYSHPNVAKEMHVGHLRSTIIGDALCRLAERYGHVVIRENHIGDWGTPFGMLIEHLLDLGEGVSAEQLSVGDLGVFYQDARAAFDASEEFRARSRKRVVLLQGGDPETLRLWQVLVDRSVEYFTTVYEEMGILLTPADVRGESFYSPMLPEVVEDLRGAGLLVEDEGALCVFPPGFSNREGSPLPLIVRKSDGGYTYATTDLAALKDRFGRLAADEAIYVVGAPQAQHLAMCFAVAKHMGWLRSGTEAVHVPFGNVLGSDHRMFSSRAGYSIRLRDLLDEARARAADAVAAHSPSSTPEEMVAVAGAVGMGALKYADLSTDRSKDYVFDWERMLAFEGNTGPYLQYAHARICSLFRRAGVDMAAAREAGWQLQMSHTAERELSLAVLDFPDAVRVAWETLSPHRLCTYLYELGSHFSAFYEACPVIGSDPETQRGRLGLSALTADVLATGLGLIGIDAPARM